MAHIEEKITHLNSMYVRSKTEKTRVTKFEAAETKRSAQFSHITICQHTRTYTATSTRSNVF